MRIDQALNWASNSLINSDSAQLDAEVLLAHTLQKESVYLMTWPERELTLTQQPFFEKLITARITGVPVAYLTGTREFWSLPLKVNNSTLIPRPDTEILVEHALALCTPQSRILDLGTGTGAIILALASERPSAQCIAVDMSGDAVQLALENVALLAIKNVTVVQSNWFENVDGTFDVIVSNPPYIDAADHHLAQGDVRFEPRSALVAGDNGLADIDLIVTQAREYLSDNGHLLIEHGFEQAKSVRDIFSTQGYKLIKTVKDYGGNERITIATYKR